VVAIAVHNLPEGFAVGAGFGGDDALGWGTALSIGMQNVPEGLIVATALWSIGTSVSLPSPWLWARGCWSRSAQRSDYSQYQLAHWFCHGHSLLQLVR